MTTGNNTGSYKLVVAAAGNDGTVRNYVSDQLTGLGGLALADFRSTPIPIDVYVNPTDPAHYYVDVSDVPNLTPERIKQLVASAVGRGQYASAAQTPPIVSSAPTAKTDTDLM